MNIIHADNNNYYFLACEWSYLCMFKYIYIAVVKVQSFYTVFMYVM